jgi:hypothetical protein
MTYDAGQGLDVLFGGNSSTGAEGDTWTFANGIWTNLTSGLEGSPLPRYNASMNYDPVDTESVLSGGSTAFAGGTAAVNDSWTIKCLATTCTTGAQWRWSLIANIGQLAHPTGVAQAYDGIDAYTISFGGDNCGAIPPCIGGTHQLLSTTQEFVNDGWTSRYPYPPPPARSGAGMTYDSADGYLMIFGGLGYPCDLNGCHYKTLADTWQFWAGGWLNISQPLGSLSTGWSQALAGSHPPGGLNNASMTYDAADGYVVLFGGNYYAKTGLETVSGATWIFQQGNWSLLNTLTPPPRIGASMTYDWALGYVVMFGGLSSGSTQWGNPVPFGDTWKFVHSIWTNITSTAGIAPSARWGSPMVFDGWDGYVLLFGGCKGLSGYGDGMNPMYDTWEFYGSWLNITSARPGFSSCQAGAAYDARDSYVVTYGGQNRQGPLGISSETQGTHTYRNGVWSTIQTQGTAPVVGSNISLTYDDSDGYVLAFGGTNCVRYSSCKQMNQSFSYSGGTWTNISTGIVPLRGDAGTITADQRDRMLLAVGSIRRGFSQGGTFDAWMYWNGHWTEFEANGSQWQWPSNRNASAVVYNGPDRSILMYGGTNTSTNWPNAYLHDTWEIGTGTGGIQLPQAGGMPGGIGGLAYSAIVYDVGDGYVLLFGGANPGVTNPTWKFQDSQWTMLNEPTAPSDRALSQMAYDARDGYVLLFGGDMFGAKCAGCAGNDTWTFSNGAWTNITPKVHYFSSLGVVIPPTPSRYDAGMAFDGYGGEVVMFGGIGSGGVLLNDTWTYQGYGAGGNWTLRKTPNLLDPREGSVVTFGLSFGEVLLFGGSDYNGGVLRDRNDTWVFQGATGSWSKLSLTNYPPGHHDAWVGWEGTEDLADGVAWYYTSWIGISSHQSGVREIT